MMKNVKLIFAFMLCSTWVFAQMTVSGTLKDGATNEPLIGASVVVKGTTNGAITDTDGKYQLKVADGNGTLVFSFVGYEPQELPINNRTVIDLSLSEGKALQEVVVVGYGTVKKSDVTGSVSSITSKQLEKIPATNVVQAMQGQAAGVDIVASSARPGAFPTIRVRGNRSLNATNNPLFVVDGIPLSEGASINDFNPTDIESIEVLKDASATAIYGARGANGVILVSMKKGKKGKAQITYSGSTSVSSPLVPFDMLNGGEMAELRREGLRNNSLLTDYTTAFPNPDQDFAFFGNQDNNLWESVADAYTWIDRSKRIAQKRPATAEEKAIMQLYKDNVPTNWVTSDSVFMYDPSKVRTTDWQSLVLRTGRQQNHQIGITGGADNLGVSFSLGYFDNQGIQKGQDYRRYSTRLGLDWSVTDKLKVGANINGNLIQQDWGTDVYGVATGQLPIAVPYDADGNVINYPGGDALIFTPLNSITGELDDRKTNRFFGSLYAEYELAKGLRYRANFGPDFTMYRRGMFQESATATRRGGTTYGRYQNDQRYNYTLENLLYYNKTLGEKHDFGVTLLQSIQNDRFESINLEVQDLPYNSQKFYNLGSTNATGADAFSSNYSLVKLMSYMGRVNYSFDNKYLFTASLRRDGSSVLAEGNKWDIFPSFAVAWKVHEEGFLKDSKFFNELKFRAGYGRTGNAAVNPYSTGGGLAKTRYAWDNNAAWGFVPNLIANPDLKWETTGQVDVGIDFSLANNRISGTFDVYRANTTDLLMDRQIPTASGFGSIQANIGATRNSGVELSLNTINIDRSSFRWNTNVIFTKNKEEIVKLYGGTNDDIGNRWFIGQPVVAYYDYVHQGVWKIAEKAAAAEYGATPGLGKFLDINGDKKIDPSNDRKIIGSNVPIWTGSMTNTLAYKGFELSAMVYARVGQTILNSYRRATLTGRYNDAGDGVLRNNYWTPYREDTEYPKANAQQERPINPEAYLYTDGSFVKLRNVTLGYNLPANMITKTGLKSLYIFGTAQNPMLWSPFKITDPEFSSSSRTFNDQLFGINLTEKQFTFGVRVGL
jgi:TonB-dependent starch-binding outer membrane protein SusC